MRYPAEHKEEVRERIIEAASRRFRRGGANVGIGQLMSALKLTHGGFYRHFKSKDELFAEALARAFEDAREMIGEHARRAKPGRELETLVGYYLSEEHCDEVARGCPVAALATDVARYGKSRRVRAAMDRAVKQHAQLMSRFMQGKTQEEKERNALTLFAMLSGVLGVARAISDPDLRRALLSGALETVLETFGRGA